MSSENQTTILSLSAVALAPFNPFVLTVTVQMIFATFINLCAKRWLKRAICCYPLVLLGSAAMATPDKALAVDQQLAVAHHYLSLSDLAKTAQVLETLGPQQSQFDSDQQQSYTLLMAAYLGLTGKHTARIALVRKAMTQSITVDTKVKYLTELADAYLNLNEYEEALLMVNQGIRLLPQLTNIDSKVVLLQGATTLLVGLNALEEAKGYAERIYQLGVEANSDTYRCQGLAHKLEIQMLMGATTAAHSMLAQTLQICANSDRPFSSDILRAKVAINLIELGKIEQGMSQALALFEQISAQSNHANIVNSLAAAIAQGYLAQNQLPLAEQFAQQALVHATEDLETKTQLRASHTLAEVKRSQGELAVALQYYDRYMAQKHLAEQQLAAKQLAYQRVKYDNLDKANQLALLKFKHNSLSLTQKLQQRNNENLLLVSSLALVLLIFMSIALILSFKKKPSLLYAESRSMLTDGPQELLHSSRLAFDEAVTSGMHFAVILFELERSGGVNISAKALANGKHSQQLLTEVTEICQSQIRQSDQFGRINDHQFVICLLQTDEKGATALTDRCRHAFEAIRIEQGDSSHHLIATFGIAMLCDSFCEFDEALSAAEKALQLAKDAGSDRVYVYHEEVADEE